jgi:hypothetical protein
MVSSEDTARFSSEAVWAGERLAVKKHTKLKTIQHRIALIATSLVKKLGNPIHINRCG